MQQRKTRIASNLLWLREHFPALYERVRGASPSDDRSRVATTRSGDTTAEVFLRDRWVAINSMYNPVQEATRWAATIEHDPATHVILFGTGLGYHLKALLELDDQVNVRIYEPHMEVFLRSMEIVDFAQLPHQRIAAWEVDTLALEDRATGQTSVQANFFSDLFSGMSLHQPEVQFVPVYRAAFPALLSSFLSNLKTFATSLRFNFGTTNMMAKYWTLNALANMRFTLSSQAVQALEPLVSNNPLIIVSSGPSLERELDNLRRLQNHAVIIASGSSVNGLLHHGIEPHAVLSIDPYINNKKVFDLMATYEKDIPFIFGTTIYFEILQDHTYTHLYHALNSQDKVTSQLMGLAGIGEYIYPDTPTVAAFTLEVAQSLGANPVIFVGQDLAFPDDKFYASGVSHHRDPALSDAERAQYFDVERVGGGKVLTSTSLNHMRQSIENLLAHYKTISPGQRFINTSTTGAKITYAEEMSLTDCINQFIDFEATWRNPFKDNKGDIANIDWEPVKALYRELWSYRGALGESFTTLVDVMEKLRSARSAKRIEALLGKVDGLFHAVQTNALFHLVYEPMLSIQIDLYRRLASDIGQDAASVEKAEVVLSRLVPLVHEYHICERLLEEADVVAQFDEESEPRTL